MCGGDLYDVAGDLRPLLDKGQSGFSAVARLPHELVADARAAPSGTAKTKKPACGGGGGGFAPLLHSGHGSMHPITSPHWFFF
jgi:hypothetical protein